jgi:hypothetical protein
MSPNSTQRRRRTARRLAIAASAVLVTVLPAACSTAHADAQHDGQQQNLAVSEILDNFAQPGEQDQNADADRRAEDGTAQSSEDANADRAEDRGRDGDGDNRGENANDENGNRDQDRNGDQNGNGRGNDNDRGRGEDGDARGGNNKGKGQNEKINGLEVLGRDCKNSDLPPHDGFQKAPRCVDTAFGEVASEDKSPSLLISQAPDVVRKDEDFTIKVSTRNLVRDRFLGAAQGGYYLESSFLDENGIQRGHFHTACRMLDSVDTAPDAAPEPDFFLATQDNGGGADPDTVEIKVNGMPRTGTAQCAVWAGDGSHRIPMMQRADQTPAFDAVRITVQ